MEELRQRALGTCLQSEEVVKPGPELRPADKYSPRALFTIPQISVSFPPFLSLFRVLKSSPPAVINIGTTEESSWGT